MTGDDDWLSEEVWRTVVTHVPIMSVDLVVTHEGGVVLGRRTNQPGRGEWFVPGGRVRKGERLTEAVHRVARTELGVEIDIERRLGVDEHFWDTTEFQDTDGKHHVTVAYVVTVVADRFQPDGQHDDLRVFEPPFDEVDLHPYVERYLRKAELIDS